jgi:hypothetical protein
MAGLCGLVQATTGQGRGPGTAPLLQRDFDVFLGNRHIGEHRFELHESTGGRQVLRSTARFEVRLLGFTAYRYRHEAEEHWSGGCLASLTANTQDNGRQLRVEAQRTPQGSLAVATDEARQDVSGCVMSYAYWDPRFLTQSRLLNPQTGRIDAVRIQPRGNATVSIGGRERPARQYELVSDRFSIQLWYSPEGEWLQLDSITQDGRRLRYRLQGQDATT